MNERINASSNADLNYFDSFSQAIDAIMVRLDRDQIDLKFGTACTSVPAEDHWTQQLCRKGPVAYEQTISADFEIIAIKGRPTKKYFHIVLYRTGFGSYELTTYVL